MSPRRCSWVAVDGTACRAFATKTSERCWGHTPARLAARQVEISQERARIYDQIASLGARLGPLERELAWLMANALPDDPALDQALRELEANDPHVASLRCQLDEALERLKGQT